MVDRADGKATGDGEPEAPTRGGGLLQFVAATKWWWGPPIVLMGLLIVLALLLSHKPTYHFIRSLF